MNAWGYKVKRLEMRKHHSQRGPVNGDLCISITIPYLNTLLCIIFDSLSLDWAKIIQDRNLLGLLQEPPLFVATESQF